MMPVPYEDIPFTRSIIRHGLRCGRGQYLIATIGTGDTTLTHSLGHIPTQYWPVRNPGGGVVYDGTNGGTDWTASVIVLRATVAGTYTIVVF
jgi:hypothetical protein